MSVTHDKVGFDLQLIRKADGDDISDQGCAIDIYLGVQEAFVSEIYKNMLNSQVKLGDSFTFEYSNRMYEATVCFCTHSTGFLSKSTEILPY